MSESDRDSAMVDLPEPPPAAPEARERAIARALARFDTHQSDKGFGADARPRSREASWMESVMVRYRPALATAAIVVVAGPIAWMIAQERAAETPSPVKPPLPAIAEPRPSRDAEVPVDRPQAAVPAAPVRTEAKPAPKAPSNLGSASDAAKPSNEAAKAKGEATQATNETLAAGSVAESESRRAKDSDAARVSQSFAPAPAPVPVPSMAPQAALSRDALVQSLAPPAPLVRSVPSRVAVLPGAERHRLPGDVREHMAPPPEPVGQDRFDGKPQSGFKTVRESPVSTFSIDVDTASYGFLRASLNRNALPPQDSVRTEELINYFPYSYAPPSESETPFSVSASVYPSPWAEGRKILRVGIKGYEIPAAKKPRANLVFLIDTSGSMSGPNRLPLVKQALSLLLTKLGAEDRIAIVAYAGQAGTILEPTPASDTAKILAAIEGLGAGGGTSGGEGLRQAYALAERNYDPAAVNRVMLATDGDFNIGITSQDELKGFVERKREKGIFLSVLGFGMGNYNDALMQALAQNGNGTAATIDTLNEARKVLVEEASATLFPIAKDVKIQVEFNPVTVAEYRLIGYETRALNRDDFENDKVDAGEVGAGQSATALYEFVPAGGARTIAPLRYGPQQPAAAPAEGEYAFVKIRYKKPDQDTSQLIENPVGPGNETKRFADADEDARFATAVAGFGEILRGGKWTGKLKLDDVLKIAAAARGDDPYGYRSEFVQLVRAAKSAQALQSARP